MTEEQRQMMIEIMHQNDAVLEMNWQILQAIAPLENDDEPDRVTLQ